MDTQIDQFLLKNAKKFIRDSGMSSHVPPDVYDEWKRHPLPICYALRDSASGIVYSFALLRRIHRDVYGRSSRPYVIDFVFTHPSYQRNRCASRLIEHIRNKDGTVYVFVNTEEHPTVCMMLQKLGFKNARTPDDQQAFLYDNE